MSANTIIIIIILIPAAVDVGVDPSADTDQTTTKQKDYFRFIAAVIHCFPSHFSMKGHAASNQTQ